MIALGIMSGTSLDGLDLALLESDGVNDLRVYGSQIYDFPPSLCCDLLSVQGQLERSELIKSIERDYTEFVIGCVQDFASSRRSFDLIGWHGQTIGHAPHEARSLQLGDGKALAEACSVRVVYDFRSNDIAAGGQGAPLAPIYHRAIAKNLKLSEPVMFVNIGGIANITYIHNDELIAFDCGVGNVLMDDVMRNHTSQSYDKNGAIASGGTIDSGLLQDWLSLPYFSKPYPKSLHREDFHNILSQLGDSHALDDSLASLCEFSVLGIIRAIDLLPSAPKSLLLCGGGRHNNFLHERLSANSDIEILRIDDFDFDGDMLEAQAFAYLAIRHLNNLPLSFPNTTGVPRALCGGVIASP